MISSHLYSIFMVRYFRIKQYVTCVIRTISRTKISLEMKIEIKALLLKTGFSQRYIGKTLSISKTCVWNMTKKLKPLLNSCGQGCKKASTTTDE